MRDRLFAAAAVAALCLPALAQDNPAPPAPAAPTAPAAAKQHVNKITPEAQAAFDKMEKAMYSPVRAGLKEMTGKVKMKMDMGGGEDMGGMGGGGMPDMTVTFDVKFKAPSDLDVVSHAQGMMAQMGPEMAKGVKSTMRWSLGLGGHEGEFDAEMTTRDGKPVLQITNFEGDVEKGKSWFTLDAQGLMAHGDIEMKADPNAGMGGMGGGTQKVTMDFSYEKFDGLQRISKMTTNVQEPMPVKMEMTVNYVNAGGFALALGFSSTIEGMPMSFGYEFTELSVNGKPVELPKTAAQPSAPKPPTGVKPQEGKEMDEGDEGDEEHEDGDR